MNSSYRVYSKQPGAEDYTKVLEVTRTDERTAREDAKLIKEIIGRPAWVEEVES